MFSDFDIQTRQMLTGNLLMIGCSVFYLAWWLIAFKPEGAIKGIRSGWLLIPALFFGVAAIALLVITLIFAVVSMVCYLLYYLSSSRDRGRRPRHARSAFFCAALPGTWTR